MSSLRAARVPEPAFIFALLAAENTVGARLLALRRSREMSRFEMAAILDVGVYLYCDYEEDLARAPRPALAQACAWFDGLSLAWLAEGRGVPYPQREQRPAGDDHSRAQRGEGKARPAAKAANYQTARLRAREAPRAEGERTAPKVFKKSLRSGAAVARLAHNQEAAGANPASAPSSGVGLPASEKRPAGPSPLAMVRPAGRALLEERQQAIGNRQSAGNVNRASARQGQAPARRRRRRSRRSAPEAFTQDGPAFQGWITLGTLAALSVLFYSWAFS